MYSTLTTPPFQVQHMCVYLRELEDSKEEDEGTLMNEKTRDGQEKRT